jgi:2-aminoadipate transaminase
MSLERRRRLVQIARERELLVLEDNPYGLLRYEGEPLPTLYSLDAANSGRSGKSDFVIYLGTFSKILSPGIRLGWAVAPRPVLEKLNLGKQGADLCSSSMTQLFVARYFSEYDWRGYLRELRELYSCRRDVMLATLREHFGEEAHWTTPQGGLFIWATLPPYIDTTNLLAQCTNVAFVPGRAAYMDAEGRLGSSSMRLNFAGLPEEVIREGVGRIGTAVERQMRLFGAVTKTPRPRRSTAGAPGTPVPPAPSGEPTGRAGRQPAETREAAPGEPRGEKGLADVVELRRRRAGGR